MHTFPPFGYPPWSYRSDRLSTACLGHNFARLFLTHSWKVTEGGDSPLGLRTCSPTAAPQGTHDLRSPAGPGS